MIYCTLRCLIAAGRELWDRRYNGDRLLFGPEDVEAPEKPSLFRELWRLPESAARFSVGHLILAAAGQLENVPPLDQLVVDSNIMPLMEDQQKQVDQLLSGKHAPPATTMGPSSDSFCLPPLPDVTHAADGRHASSLQQYLPLVPTLIPPPESSMAASDCFAAFNDSPNSDFVLTGTPRTPTNLLTYPDASPGIAATRKPKSLRRTTGETPWRFAERQELT